jgi:hypothetical protein
VCTGFNLFRIGTRGGGLSDVGKFQKVKKESDERSYLGTAQR